MADADVTFVRARHFGLVHAMSTVFDDAVATQDTVTQLVAAMRKVARLVPGAQEVVWRVGGLDYSKPGKPQIDWDDPDAKQQLVSDLVNDALAVLAGLTGDGTPERDAAAADALGLLALVAGLVGEPRHRQVGAELHDRLDVRPVDRLDRLDHVAGDRKSVV